MRDVTESVRACDVTGRTTRVVLVVVALVGLFTRLAIASGPRTPQSLGEVSLQGTDSIPIGVLLSQNCGVEAIDSIPATGTIVDVGAGVLLRPARSPWTGRLIDVTVVAPSEVLQSLTVRTVTDTASAGEPDWFVSMPATGITCGYRTFSVVAREAGVTEIELAIRSPAGGFSRVNTFAVDVAQSATTLTIASLLGAASVAFVWLVLSTAVHVLPREKVLAWLAAGVPASILVSGSFGYFAVGYPVGDQIIAALVGAASMFAAQATSIYMRVLRGSRMGSADPPGPTTSSEDESQDGEMSAGEDLPGSRPGESDEAASGAAGLAVQVREPGPEPRPPADPPDELLQAVSSNECILWVGSGLSAQAGLPTWTGLLAELLETGTSSGSFDPETAAPIAARIRAGYHQAAADEIEARMGTDAVREYVMSRLSDAKPSAAHETLGRIPFAGVITTPFDNLLNQVLQKESLIPGQGGQLFQANRQGEQFLFHLNGSIDDPSSLVFSWRDFRQSVARDRRLGQALNTLFERDTWFFVGSSARGIGDYLDGLDLDRTERRHYALIGESAGVDTIEVSSLDRRYNIEVIDFVPSAGYPEITSFLERIRSATEGPADRQLKGPPILTGLTLINIGPYEELQLTFDREFNLLLGDNGVGKTIILKAIAAALAGEYADEALIGALLRTGAHHGSITLHVGSREYSVELERDGLGRVEVVSKSASPLVFDNWLALGFPALRAITLDRPESPFDFTDTVSTQPNATVDLAPILVGAPDTRLSRLKAWLVAVDYQRKKGDEGAVRLWKRFFDALDTVVLDMKVESAEVDSEMRIWVETDSGRVPLEAVSQGTASMMCWVGTILQRLHDVHSKLEDPEGGGALVLIDEIAAHMHPTWQQGLRGALKRTFTSIQFVANTHSPLMVGSMDPKEVKLVRRSPLFAPCDGLVRLEEVEGSEEGEDSVRVLILPSEGSEDDSVVWQELVGDADDRGVEADHPPEPAEPAEPAEDPDPIRFTVARQAGLLVGDGHSVRKGDRLTRENFLVVVEDMDFDGRGWRADQILTSPIFGLSSSRDLETEADMLEYTELAARSLDGLDPEDQERFQELSEVMSMRLPSTEERAEARIAYEAIQEALAYKLMSLSEEDRPRVIAELKSQLLEAVTGEDRPDGGILDTQ